MDIVVFSYDVVKLKENERLVKISEILQRNGQTVGHRGWKGMEIPGRIKTFQTKIWLKSEYEGKLLRIEKKKKMTKKRSKKINRSKTLKNEKEKGKNKSRKKKMN